MEKVKKYRFLIIAIVAIILESFIVLHFLEKERKNCTKIMVLNTGDTLIGWQIHPHNTGLIEINKCDGSTLLIPNDRIKEIIQK